MALGTHERSQQFPVRITHVELLQWGRAHNTRHSCAGEDWQKVGAFDTKCEWGIHLRSQQFPVRIMHSSAPHAGCCSHILKHVCGGDAGQNPGFVDTTACSSCCTHWRSQQLPDRRRHSLLLPQLSCGHFMRQSWGGEAAQNLGSVAFGAFLTHRRLQQLPSRITHSSAPHLSCGHSLRHSCGGDAGQNLGSFGPSASLRTHLRLQQLPDRSRHSLAPHRGSAQIARHVCGGEAEQYLDVPVGVTSPFAICSMLWPVYFHCPSSNQLDVGA